MDEEDGVIEPLHNALIDLMVVTGIDESRLLSTHQPVIEDVEDILSAEFTPLLLCVIGPSSTMKFYPDICEEHCTDARYYSHNTSEGDNSRQGKEGGQNGELTSDKSAFTSDSSSGMSSAGLTLQDDLIKSLPAFCFPDNICVYDEKPEDFAHSIVLTDVNGQKSYAACLTFYRPFHMSKNNADVLMLCGCDDSAHADAGQMLYIPKCVSYLSKYAYLTTLKDCLSHMVYGASNSLDFKLLEYRAKEMTRRLAWTPVPPAGTLQVHVECLPGCKLVLQPSDYPEKPVIDLPTYLLFLCFSMPTVTQILACILTEERIVFLSSSYAMITIIMESFLHFILPFRWRYTYVPIVPSSSLEFLEAPTCFLMGCHSRYLDQVQTLPGLVIVDIDTGSVSRSSSSDLDEDDEDEEQHEQADDQPLPSLPSIPAQTFCSACERSKFSFDLIEADRPTPTNAQELCRKRSQRIQQFNREVSFQCLTLLVNLFRGVVLEIRMDLKTFNQQQFLEKQDAIDLPFYQKVVTTDMFKVFVSDRLSDHQDYWDDLETCTRPVTKGPTSVSMRRGSLGGQLLHRSALRRPSMAAATAVTGRRLSSVGTTTIAAAAMLNLSRVLQPVHLPAVQFCDPVTRTTEDYLRHCISYLTNKIETCRDSSQRAGYWYLRAMFFISFRQPVAAMDDFVHLFALNTGLFPIGLVKSLYGKLNDKQQSEVQSKPYFRMRGVFNLVDRTVQRHQHQVLKHQLSYRFKRDLGKAEFAEYVSLMDISSDYEASLQLFEALTNFSAYSVVDKYTMVRFYECWECSQRQNATSLKLAEGHLDEGEILLKVSALIKTDYGTGRLALTDHRLFLLTDVSSAYHEIINIADIGSLDKIQHSTFLISDVDALRITSQGASSSVYFTACLKEQRDLWYLLISEMCSGMALAEMTSDPSLVHQAAQNVILVDALYISGQDVRTMHHSAVDRVTEHMCLLTRFKQETLVNYPNETRERLQLRLDANLGEKERRAVECLLYTDQFVSEEDCLEPARLWCGLSNGLIKVYDASTWMLDFTFDQAITRVVSLLAVGTRHVWAGSFGVYVFDTELLSCDAMLMEHTDLVSGMILSQDGSYVYSCSLNGEVIQWHSSMFTIIQRFTLRTDIHSLLSIQPCQTHSDNDDKNHMELWCCNKKNLLLVASGSEECDSSVLQSLSYSDDSGRLVLLDCFIIDHTGNVWAGCARRGQVVIWETESFATNLKLELDCVGISKMLLLENKVWVTSKCAAIYIISVLNKSVETRIEAAHSDVIRAICTTSDRSLVFTAAGSQDGKIAIWKTDLQL